MKNVLVTVFNISVYTWRPILNSVCSDVKRLGAVLSSVSLSHWPIPFPPESQGAGVWLTLSWFQSADWCTVMSLPNRVVQALTETDIKNASRRMERRHAVISVLFSCSFKAIRLKMSQMKPCATKNLFFSLIKPSFSYCLILNSQTEPPFCFTPFSYILSFSWCLYLFLCLSFCVNTDFVRGLPSFNLFPAWGFLNLSSSPAPFLTKHFKVQNWSFCLPLWGKQETKTHLLTISWKKKQT